MEPIGILTSIMDDLLYPESMLDAKRLLFSAVDRAIGRGCTEVALFSEAPFKDDFITTFERRIPVIFIADESFISSYCGLFVTVHSGCPDGRLRRFLGDPDKTVLSINFNTGEEKWLARR